MVPGDLTKCIKCLLLRSHIEEQEREEASFHWLWRSCYDFETGPDRAGRLPVALSAILATSRTFSRTAVGFEYLKVDNA